MGTAWCLPGRADGLQYEVAQGGRPDYTRTIQVPPLPQISRMTVNLSVLICQTGIMIKSDNVCKTLFSALCLEYGKHPEKKNGITSCERN